MPYLGQRPSKGDENNFKILDNISSYTLTFDGSDAAVVSAANDTITSLSHRFVQGQRVTYNKGGGTVITGLSDGVYYIIKNDHNTIKLATSASNAANGTAVNITGVGAGSSHTLNVAFDGVNTKFKATHTNGQKAKITRSAQLVISINGVIQQPHDSATPSTGFGFDLDGTIVFSQAPVVGDVYWAHVLTNNNVTFDISDNDVDNFTGNASTTAFNLSKTPPDNRNILVTIDGVVQYPNDPDGTVRAYNVVENVLTFTTAPVAGAEIQVRHIGFAGSSSGSGGGGVTNFYGRTGSVVLKNTDNIVANNAEFAGNLTVQGTMTTLDTKVTEVDQLEVAANNTTVGVAITQSGTGDILNLYDGSTERFSVADNGIVTISAGANNEGLRITGQHNNAVIFTSPSINGSAGYRLNHHPSTNFLRVDTTDQNGTFTGTVAKFSSAGLDMSDNIKLRLGTNQDLTLYHYGNDAYIDNADGDIIVRQGTSEKVRIKSDGKVGIGTDNPQKQLQILGDADTCLRLTSSAGGVASYQLGDTTDTVKAGITLFNSDNSLRIRGYNNSERIIITSGGLVGIGSVNPANSLDVQGGGHAKIHIGTTGTAHATGIQINHAKGNAALQEWQLQTDGSADGNLIVRNATTGTSTMFFDADNNYVGINETNPSAQLHVENNNAHSSTYYLNTDATVLIQNKNSLASAKTVLKLEGPVGGGDCAIVYGDSSANLIFSDRQNERLRITSGGSVNIGGDYTQTSSKLKVTGTVTVDGGFALSAGSFTAPGGFSINSGNVIMHQYIAHDADSDSFFGFPANNRFKLELGGKKTLEVRADGNVGFGTDNPQTDFEFFGYSAAASGSAPVVSIRNGYSGTVDQSNALKSELRFLHKNHNAAHDFMATRIIADTTDNYMQRTFLRFLVANANNGTERLTISPYGRVGINSTAPSHDLDVVSSSNAYIKILKSGSNPVYIGNAGGEGVIETTSATFFKTGGYERLRITSGGDLEISTTTTTSPRYLKFNSNRSSADDALGGIYGVWNGNSVAAINFKTGADTTNKDDGRIQFITYAGGTAKERMMIREDGQIILGNVSNTGGNTNSAVHIESGGMNVESSYDTDDTSGGAPHLTLSGQSTRVRLDFGTMTVAPYAGWIQARYDNNPFGNSGTDDGLEPLCINPRGGVLGYNIHDSSAMNAVGGGGASVYGGIIMRSGRAVNTTVNNNSTAIKIFPAEVRAYSGTGGTGEQNEGTKYGGIAWNVLDPHNGSWGSNHNGHHCWMGMSLHSTPAQEKSNWQVQMNSNAGAGTFATNVAIQANPEGYITKPNHPSFHVGSPNNSGASGGEVWKSHSNAIYSNNGNHYDNSTGRFTAPIAGTYFFFHWGMTQSNSASTTDVYSRKNGSRDQIGTSYNSNSGGTNGYHQFGCSYVRVLAKGDYVDVYTSSGSIYYTTDGRHGGWGGWLIG